MMQRRVGATGPRDAEIVIVGEAPGAQEELQGAPFVGASGRLLTEMLHAAGIVRTDCYITNVSQIRPPGNNINAFFLSKREAKANGVEPIAGKFPNDLLRAELQRLHWELATLEPKVIVALGNTALWALTGHDGVGSWRGSVIETPKLPCPVVPTYHPAGVLRMYEWLNTAIRDLRRAKAVAAGTVTKPSYRFHIEPTFDEVMQFLGRIIPNSWLAVDIETYNKHLTTLGIAISETEALCIPFYTPSLGNYWTLDEELAIVLKLKEVLQDNLIIGQNFAYDAQYIIRYWGFCPNLAFDTMVAHQCAFPGTPKSLDYLSSLYLPWHCFWKHEAKEAAAAEDDHQAWEYNAKDCVVTFALREILHHTLQSYKLTDVFRFQMRLWWPVLRMQLRGLRVDLSRKAALASDLLARQQKEQASLVRIVGHEINPRSPQQMHKLFREELALPLVAHKKTGRPTFNSEALRKLAQKEPLVGPIVDRIERLRSLGVFFSTFVQAEVDADGKLRTSLDIAGTETFRFASRKNVFGTGGNMQNVPSGDDYFPNIRNLFVPDPGMCIFDVDLDRADAQVVAWEAGDDELKQMFREGVDIHTENAKVLGCSRKLAKMAVHGANYGVGVATMSAGLGVSRAQAEYFRNRWFSAHPKIKEWHHRIEAQLMSTRSVYNAFGYRRYYFGRIQGLLPQALAWIPQSTVACVINRLLVAIDQTLPYIQLLLQVHDSLVFQCRIGQREQAIRDVWRLSQGVVVPYPDPLVIPVGFKWSARSWGEAQEVSNDRLNAIISAS